MNDVNEFDLFVLGCTECHNTDAKIQKFFEWQFERDKTLFQLSFTSSSGLLVAFLVATARSDQVPDPYALTVMLVMILTSFVFGFYMLSETRQIHKRYTRAVKIYKNLADLFGFPYP